MLGFEKKIRKSLDERQELPLRCLAPSTSAGAPTSSGRPPHPTADGTVSASRFLFHDHPWLIIVLVGCMVFLHYSVNDTNVMVPESHSPHLC